MRREPTEHATMMIGACDSREARVLLVRSAWPDRLHVEELRRLSNRWLDFHDRGRPIMLGRGPSANAVQRYADEHREPAELAERFAREAVRWFEDVAQEMTVKLERELGSERGPGAQAAPLPVFAADRVLGRLRAAAEKSRSNIVLLHGDLAPLRASELAVHPLVQKLVNELVKELVRSGAGGTRELPSTMTGEALPQAQARAKQGRSR